MDSSWLLWTPDRPGTYELSVQATDNAGQVSGNNQPFQGHRGCGYRDIRVRPSLVRMTEPVPGGFGFLFQIIPGSSLFINVLAYDPDGDLEYVKIFP